ncbi:MAG: hypothetical protein ISQ49_04530 [Synechococcus sp. BS307-5m-G35]|nr:hypothetical protein [Synechococcus sp. BS307-5m-G35]
MQCRITIPQQKSRPGIFAMNAMNGAGQNNQRALMCNFPLQPTIGRNQKGKSFSQNRCARTIHSINQKTHQQQQDISSADLAALSIHLDNKSLKEEVNQRSHSPFSDPFDRLIYFPMVIKG